MKTLTSAQNNLELCDNLVSHCWNSSIPAARVQNSTEPANSFLCPTQPQECTVSAGACLGPPNTSRLSSPWTFTRLFFMEKFLVHALSLQLPHFKSLSAIQSLFWQMWTSLLTSSVPVSVALQKQNQLPAQGANISQNTTPTGLSFFILKCYLTTELQTKFTFGRQKEEG